MPIEHQLLAVNGIDLSLYSAGPADGRPGVAAARLSRVLVRLASADRGAEPGRLPGIRPGDARLRPEQRATRPGRLRPADPVRRYPGRHGRPRPHPRRGGRPRLGRAGGLAPGPAGTRAGAGARRAVGALRRAPETPGHRDDAHGLCRALPLHPLLPAAGPGRGRAGRRHRPQPAPAARWPGRRAAGRQGGRRQAVRRPCRPAAAGLVLARTVRRVRAHLHRPRLLRRPQLVPQLRAQLAAHRATGRTAGAASPPCSCSANTTRSAASRHRPWPAWRPRCPCWNSTCCPAAATGYRARTARGSTRCCWISSVAITPPSDRVTGRLGCSQRFG